MDQILPFKDITDIAIKVAEKLGIESSKLTDIIQKHESIKGKITFEEKHKGLLDQINDLLEKDNEINKFQDKLKGSSEKLLANFSLLKQNLGKLQILILLKNLESSENCDDMLNSFILVLNNKLESVNSIMETSVAKKLDEPNKQTGGGNNKYFYKYNKYKFKYLSLKNIIT